MKWKQIRQKTQKKKRKKTKKQIKINKRKTTEKSKY